jgi:CheY-like chemotaxis protein
MNIPLEPPTILIVEDTDWIRSGMKHAAEQCGYLVAEARNELEALHFAEHQTLDLVLTEEKLPDFTVLVERVQAHPAFHDVPIVIIDPDAREGARVGEALVVKDYDAIVSLLGSRASRPH